MNEVKVNKLYVYSYWLWLWAVLYFFDFVKYSPLITLFIAFVVTSINLFFNKVNNDVSMIFKIYLSLLEFILFFIVFIKNSQINMNDIIANLVVLGIYFLILFINNVNVFKIYFVDLPNEGKNLSGYDYIVKKLWLGHKSYLFVFFGIIILGLIKKYKIIKI